MAQVEGLKAVYAAGRAESLPWLQRQLELERMRETVERLKRTYVYTVDEIVQIIGERYRRLKPRRPGPRGRIELELRRLELVYNISTAKLREALQLPPQHMLSPFHRELINAFIGIDVYEEALSRVRRGIRLIKRFWTDYRLLIISAENPREAARFRREGSGRILSTVRRLKKSLLVLRKVREELLRTHIVAEGLPVVVIAGIPSAGKSTLVSKLSTAKPEIASYPFTTKTIIVGKVTDSFPSFYIVDTPGILERPPEKHNEIERRALAAIRTLPDVLLYLFDPSPESSQGLEEQYVLLEKLVELLPGRVRIVVAVNKVDLIGGERLDSIIRLIDERTGSFRDRMCGNSVLAFSALQGQGLGELKRVLGECVRKAAPWLLAGQ